MGGELDDAIAQQKAIAAEIAKQQAALAALQKTASTLNGQLASTRAALATTSGTATKRQRSMRARSRCRSRRNRSPSKFPKAPLSTQKRRSGCCARR
jgi:septal ring factor EnvC (AmiA/AmiB activator)